MITSLTEYAGFWRRATATLIDLLWMLPLLLLLSYMIYGHQNADIQGDISNMIQQGEWQMLFTKHLWQAFLINAVLPIMLIILFWIGYGATPGKLLLDCQIVDAHSGLAITPKQALLRCIGYFISILFFLLGFLWIIIDKRKQALHDKIAGTIVVIHDEATIPLPQPDSLPQPEKSHS
jgi:uncharacterized RDD family membrane protein YckC